jgi:hypothetical protein
MKSSKRFRSSADSATIDDEMLKPDVDATGFRGCDGCAVIAQCRMDHVRAGRSELLPAGFMQQSQTRPSAPAGQERFIISDGLAWVSVFVETTTPDAREEWTFTPRPDGAVQMGASAAYTLRTEASHHGTYRFRRLPSRP